MRRLLILAALLALAPFCASAQIIPGALSGNGSMTFQAGRFYTSNGVVTVAAGAAATGSLIAALPIYIPNTITLQTLSCETSGTVSGTAHARMALYTDAGGVPGAPVAGADSGDLTQTTAGVLTSPTLGVSLSPGWYWPVWESSGLAGGTINAASGSRPSVNTQTGSNSIIGILTPADSYHLLLMTHTYGSALATWGTSSESIANTPPVIVLGF